MYVSPIPGIKDEVLCQECFNDMSGNDVLKWLGMDDEVKNWITLVMDYE